jgi:hypothetical protein
MRQDAALRLGAADALLASAVSGEMLLVFEDDRDHFLVREAMRDALPLCNRENRAVASLAEVAEKLLVPPRGIERVRLHAEARRALVRWHRDRLLVLYAQILERRK